ncbi:MAG: hypothetical protein HY316_08990 [Acidobacteria bacterium]|nr:hypothetical protein [Acidobacteriota bacterium]
MMGEAIFRFLFKYPPVAFERGRVALTSGWPGWVLAILMVLAAALVGWYLWRQQARLATREKVFVWAAQSLTLAILLVMLWRPSLILSTLVPQRNLLAVLVDDSASMAMTEDGVPRVERVKEVLDDSSPLLAELREKFQVRSYSFSDTARRLPSAEDLKAAGTGSRIEGALGEVYAELRHLPLAGMVVVSDGAQNLAASSREVLDEIEARKIPIYTLGVGRTELSRDLQLDGVALARSALPGSLLTADITVRQRGYIGRDARLEVREGNRILATKELHFGPEPVQTIPLSFTPTSKGIKEYTFRLVAPAGEEVQENNSQSRLVEVQDRAARVLYIEGEPRWEYKFLRRALEQEESLRIASLLRTSQNKFYRQGLENEKELSDGLPDPKDLFKYEGLIIGSIGSSFFSAEQQKSIYDFVSRRGGGVLFLGGREALAAGGYQNSSLTDLIPVELQTAGASASFHFAPAKFQLTSRGWDKLQLSSDADTNKQDWDKLPPLGTYQLTGEPKPGAVVLGEGVAEDGDRFPLLVSQRFGRGRSVMFATDGSWRWQMELESANRSHEIFWRQLLHALISETPAPVSISADKALYADEKRVRLTAHVYDEDFQPVNAASAVATIHSPDGTTQEVPLQHAVDQDGVFWAEVNAAPVGVYRVDLNAQNAGKPIGTGSSYFQRADGILEHFSPEQNVQLLTRMAEQTGGRYYPLEEASALPEQLTYSPAGVSVPEIRDLWDMPVWLLLLLLLKGGEWVLRKRWKTV